MSGIAGSSPKSPIQSIASFQISAAHHNGRSIELTAIVLPKVTCDLPVHPVPFDLSWKHISNLPLADPSFGEPGRVDITGPKVKFPMRFMCMIGVGQVRSTCQQQIL